MGTLILNILAHNTNFPNDLDPIAFKEAALARLRNVAVSFESGAARSTLAVALAVCVCQLPHEVTRLFLISSAFAAQ